jgi:hypothetical protein
VYLSELAVAIRNAIRDSEDSSWGGYNSTGYVVGTEVGEIPVRFSLDPLTDSGIDSPAIYVIPGFCEYSLSNKRASYQPVMALKFITIAVAVKITTDDNTVYDVTSEPEAIKLLDLKEDLDNFILGLAIPGASLEEIEVEPPNEVQLKDSYYLAISLCGYRTCSV